MVSDTFTPNTEVQLPDEGEDTCRVGRLFMVVLSLLGYWPVFMVLTAWHIHDGLHAVILKE